jgi:cell division protein FtsI/penicillin-binding protein 2
MQMAIITNVAKNRSIVIPKIIIEEKSQVIRENYFDEVNRQRLEEAMKMVVSRGTARKAFNNFNIKNIEVYGKTGTAQKGKGNLEDGWFVAYTKNMNHVSVKDKVKEVIGLKKKKGDIIIATVVRNSGYGGRYSATITKKIIEAWYKKEIKKEKDK